MDELSYKKWQETFKKQKVNLYENDFKNFKIDFSNCWFEDNETPLFCHMVFCSANFKGVHFNKFVNFGYSIFIKNPPFGVNTNGADIDKGISDEDLFNRGKKTGEENKRPGKLKDREDSESDIEFSNTIFNGAVSFKGSIFLDDVSFNNSYFHRLANFDKVHFSYMSLFTNATFLGRAKFNGAVFNESHFIRCIFKHIAEFNDAEFKKLPPRFEGAECDAILFNEAKFENTISEDTLHESASAWAALIRLMERVHNLPQRKIFHEKLLKVEKHFSSEKGARPLYNIYKSLGSGRYISLPLIWLIWFSIFMTIIYWVLGKSFINAIAFSFANTVPFMGYNKTMVSGFITSFSKSEVLQSGLMLLGVLHSIISILLIFLIGLALRNRFRIK